MTGKPVDPSDLGAKWERWIALVTEMHEEFQVHQNAEVAFTPLKRPVSEAKLALLSTGGVHLKTDAPFDLASPDGDPTIRLIPGDVDPADLTVSHAHYDTEMALEDVDCVISEGGPTDLTRLASSLYTGFPVPAHRWENSPLRYALEDPHEQEHPIAEGDRRGEGGDRDDPEAVLHHPRVSVAVPESARRQVEEHAGRG